MTGSPFLGPVNTAYWNIFVAGWLPHSRLSQQLGCCMTGSRCAGLHTGVEVSLPNSVLGLKFSWPIYKSGFQVLIASTVEEGGTWAFAGVRLQLECLISVL